MRLVENARYPWQGRIGRIEYMVQLPGAAIAGYLLVMGVFAIPVHLVRLAGIDPDAAILISMARVVDATDGALLAVPGLVVMLTVLSIPVVRRLHDLDLGGQWAALAMGLALVSIIAIQFARLAESALAVLLLAVSTMLALGFLASTLLTPGTRGPNRFGR